MITITGLVQAPCLGAFFYDDQAAIRAGRDMDGGVYLGAPVTPGFSAVRIPAAAVSVGVMMSNGAVAWGDMVSVQYSGAAGRDPVFSAKEIVPFVDKVIAPRLVGRDAGDAMANCVAAFAPHDDECLPAAVGYGLSQALLRAEAVARSSTMTEVLCKDLALPLPAAPVPLFAQSGEQRRANVDPMILKGVGVLPHGLINSRAVFGSDGAALLDYAGWVAARVREIGAPDYRPVLHFDVYGWVGIGIGLDPVLIAGFAARLAEATGGLKVNLECPADYGSKEGQVENYARIVEEVDARCDSVAIVADEYCNTLDDVREFCAARAAHIVQVKTPDVGSLYDTAAALCCAKDHGIGAYSGGSCAETDLSARASAHVALACKADMMLAKPGMGVDEGISIVGNEQARVLALLGARRSAPA